MSVFTTEITLKNSDDIALASRGYIKEDEIRQTTVEAMVDTGAWTLVINKETSDRLGLRVVGYEDGTMADGRKEQYEMVGPVEIWWKDRFHICPALVLPDAADILLGALPLEAMDLTVNCKRELVGKHGDFVVHQV